MKTTKQSAIEYGVPMPETCELLNWQRHSNLYWVENKESNKIVCSKDELEYYCPEEMYPDEKFYCVPSPQMCQLLAANPEISYVSLTKCNALRKFAKRIPN